ncbi:hypothetical protein [Agriterribacter sp.]|uniref:hypothetical protein n=1 Tax=Agriterribacter sp. TaxID=2821509 RepID=UPI002BDF8DFD|nr:hypothetical protein [Agriterribacter sp.]HRP55551.1 hypothetical protein [Agriterribacter sp.]
MFSYPARSCRVRILTGKLYSRLIAVNILCIWKRSVPEKVNAIEIAPDGSIVHINKDRGIIFRSTNGLGESVAPGSRIAIEDTNQLTMQQIKTYRNIKTGRSITDDFILYYDLHFKSR